MVTPSSFSPCCCSAPSPRTVPAPPSRAWESHRGAHPCLACREPEVRIYMQRMSRSGGVGLDGPFGCFQLRTLCDSVTVPQSDPVLPFARAMEIWGGPRGTVLGAGDGSAPAERVWAAHLPQRREKRGGTGAPHPSPVLCTAVPLGRLVPPSSSVPAARCPCRAGERAGAVWSNLQCVLRLIRKGCTPTCNRCKSGARCKECPGFKL